MLHPELLLLPILMFSDYYLTVLGAVRREEQYALHFKTEHYELNPAWQKAIAEKKWFNPRHALLTVLLSGALIALMEIGLIPDDLAKGFAGAILVLYGMIIGRHLSNLLIFSHLNRKPEEITGAITMTYPFLLYMSQYQTMTVLVPVAFIALLTQNAYAVGGVVGILLFMLIQFKWIHKAEAPPKEPEKEEKQ
jgi:hypothetical protein